MRHRVDEPGAAWHRAKAAEGDGCMGRSRGRLTIKNLAQVDAAGGPVRLYPTLGQAGDAPVGTAFAADLGRGATLIADAAAESGPA
ncbi:MAG: hypothetical protein AAGA32_07450 [Pseudomonadota bacterium]